MARHSAMVILLLALLGLVCADQICIQTKSKPDWSLRTTTYGGTNCPLRVQAYIKNVGWRYAFIDKYSTSNWRSTEFGQAYVSKQRVHEHTDTCFEMQTGFNSVDLNENIYVKFTDPNCNDAMYVDRFFIPQRKAWGISNTQGWCMNGKKHLENNYEFDISGGYVSTFNDGCARQWRLSPSGAVYSDGNWGSSSGFGTRGSGRRALREVEPVQDFRFMGLPKSERQEISLIEALYDVCENFDLGEDFRSSDRYERETEQIVRRCYDMLSHFQGTYQEFEAKEERAILLTEHRSLTEEMERVLDERLPREKKERLTEDLETSESDSMESASMDRLMSKIRSLP